MVTWPLAAVTVTGKLAGAAETVAGAGAETDAAAEPAAADVLALAADVLREDDEQPVRAAVQAGGGGRPRAERRGGVVGCWCLPRRGREGGTPQRHSPVA